MNEKPTYHELEQRIAFLESEQADYKIGATEEFKRLADRSRDTIYRYDLRSRRYPFFNKTGLDQYGVEEGDEKKVTPKIVLLRIHPDDRERVKKASLNSLIPGSKGGEVEYRFMHPDGSTRWMHDRWIVIRDSSGEPTAIEGFVRDETERKKVEEVLRESEELIRSTLESTADGILVVDEIGQVIESNARFAAMWRIPDHLMESGDDQALLNHVREQLLEPETFLSKVQKLYKTFEEDLDTIYFKDGRVFERYSCPLIRGEKNAGRVWSFRDVTDKKRAEERLNREKEWFRVLAEESPLGVSLVKKDGVYQYVNPKFVEIFGYTLKDIPTGRQWFRKAFPDSVYRKRVITTWIKDQKAVKTGEARSRIFRVTCKDGLEKAILFRPVNMETGDQLVIYEDITDRIRLETQLQQAQKMEAVGTLAGGIAHDFNNLLSIILGNITLAYEDAAAGIDISEFLNEAEKAVSKAKKLIHKIITFSKGGDPIKRIVSIEQLLNESAKLVLSYSKIEYEIFISDNLWPVACDYTQMQHAFSNIFNNSKEALVDGGSVQVYTENFFIQPDREMTDLPLKEGKYVKIDVHDKGVGIPEENLLLIFDPYFSTKEMGVQKGLGLGLAATYSIVKRHDGHITVDSKVGAGTTFHIYLPAGEREKFLERESATSSVVDHPSPTRKILVMDDEEAIRKITDQILDRLGYQVALARNGEEAIEIFEAANQIGEPFDAVILDLTVKGGMGGRDAVKKLLEIDSGVRAIIASGYFNDPVLADFKAYGFCGVIAKPYSVGQLSDVLQKILNGDPPTPKG